MKKKLLNSWSEARRSAFDKRGAKGPFFCGAPLSIHWVTNRRVGLKLGVDMIGAARLFLPKPALRYSEEAE
jgi:hypothetical protein